MQTKKEHFYVLVVLRPVFVSFLNHHRSALPAEQHATIRTLYYLQVTF